MAQRVGRVIALLLHDRGTRRWWVVSSTPRPHFTSRKDPVPILQEAGWAPGPVWTGGKSRPHRDSIPDRPARSQSLYRLSYRAHVPFHITSRNVLLLIAGLEFKVNSLRNIRIYFSSPWSGNVPVSRLTFTQQSNVSDGKWLFEIGIWIQWQKTQDFVYWSEPQWGLFFVEAVFP